MRYIYPLAIIMLLVGVVVPLNAYGAVLIDQQLSETSASAGTPRHLGQSFTALSNNVITAIRVKPCERDFTGFDEILTMWEWNSTSTPPIEIASTTFDGVDHSIACNSSTPFFRYILDETFSITTGNEYAFSLRATDAVFDFVMRISLLDPYDGGLQFAIRPDGTNFAVSPSDDLAFEILSDLSFFDDFNSTSTVNILETTCDSTSNLFTNSLCRLALVLFVPSPDVLNQFDNLRNDLENKPPFGYLTAIISELENLESATATIAFPDLSDLQDNFFTPLKIGISSLLFFMLAFWFFNRFRNFEL